MNRKGAKRRTEFRDLSNAEVSQRARDKTLPVNRRRAYQQEEIPPARQQAEAAKLLNLGASAVTVGEVSA
ncbi:MAG: hypothetical protein ICV69_04290 [Thermoleophilaceae bacterium]|nr:hypothetical protein [Thermoleophilaceae bacterium]